jgi:glucan biosynthesis protein C
VRRERRFDLDWIRIAAFGLLILYHIGMVFVPWSYHVKSTHLIAGLEPALQMLNPWRLSLLFVVAGAATHVRRIAWLRPLFGLKPATAVG